MLLFDPVKNVSKPHLEFELAVNAASTSEGLIGADCRKEEISNSTH
jgi:hypothetical protein